MVHQLFDAKLWSGRMATYMSPINGVEGGIRMAFSIRPYVRLSLCPPRIWCVCAFATNRWSDWAQIWCVNSFYDSPAMNFAHAPLISSCLLFLAFDWSNCFRIFTDKPLIGLSTFCDSPWWIKLLVTLRWILIDFWPLICRAVSMHFQTNYWLDWPQICCMNSLWNSTVLINLTYLLTVNELVCWWLILTRRQAFLSTKDD